MERVGARAGIEVEWVGGKWRAESDAWRPGGPSRIGKVKPGRVTERVTAIQLNRRRAMCGEKVLHGFVQQGHDASGKPECLEAEGVPGPAVRLDVDQRELDVAGCIWILIWRYGERPPETKGIRAANPYALRNVR